MASENVQKIREFWHQFFNEGNFTAFDELRDDSYCENGNPSDGEGLKQWVASVRKEIDINVAITREVETDNRVAIYWIANPVSKETGKRVDNLQGINILEFKDGKIVNNWHCRGAA